MKRTLILLILLILIMAPGCTSAEALEDTVYFTDINTTNLTSVNMASGNITLGGAPLLIPAYGEIYNTEFLTVECVVANTYYPVTGNTTTGEILGFEDNGLGRLTYTDVTPNRICLITTAMSVSVPAEDRPAIISTKIYQNGVADNASYIGEYISDADPADALPVMCLMELLNPDDYIEIYLASNTANTTVVVNTLTLVATTVD